LRRATTILVAAGIACGACAAQAQVKVRFGILTTASQAAFLVGVEKGIFAKHGFDVEVKPLATGVQANQALAADQVDWSGGGMESTIVAWGAALPFKAYSMYAKGGDSYGILVRADAKIASAKDLQGKRVAVPSGTAPAQGLSQILESVGLRGDAVKRVNANYGNMGQMLIQGAVDAMVGLEPFITLTQEQMGDKAVLLTRLGKYVQGGGLFLMTDVWTKAHPDKVKEAVTALWEAQQYVRQHPAEAAALDAKFLKVEPRIVEVAFKYLTYSPLIDPFTVESLKKTTTYLKSEGLLANDVDVGKELAQADRVIGELQRETPNLLQ
jgi:ABC-type nitrate/sulfonate/bicarbonate transport system substrate-binding protein